MTGREHIAIGVFTTAVGVGAWQSSHGGIDLASMVPALAAAAAGSLGPDLDHPGSLASMSIPGALVGYATVFLVVRAYEAGHGGGLSLGLATLGPQWVAAAWAALAAGLGLFALSFVFAALFGHRGPVHSIAFGVGASVLLALGLATLGAPASLAFAFLWGWVAHLLADAMTARGLAHILWPLSARD